MKKNNEVQATLSREELIQAINRITIDARAKLERLKNDNSDTAYELSCDFEEIINDFESAADYLDGIYEEVILCLNN